MVLKGTGEVDAESEEQFTYRVPQDDRGKYRLTAATPKSRDPIRVLRSHSINSIWGPKAGIRYEGLYSVVGWSIKQAKTPDTANGQWKEGDILYDIKFERSDPVPMSEAIRRPQATEVDDYVEYKRLRKLYREGKRNATNNRPEMVDEVIPAKLAPAIAPPPQQLTAIFPGLPASPSTSRETVFKKTHSEKKSHVQFSTYSGIPIMNVPDDDASPFTKRGSSLLKVPIKSTTRPQPSNLGEISLSGSPDHSRTSSIRTGISGQSNIKEVAPWLDCDTNLVLPELPVEIPHVRDCIFSQTLKPSTEGLNSAPHSAPRGRRKRSTDFKIPSSSATKKDNKKMAIVRNRSPISKLFDGSVDEGSEEVFDFDRDAICPPNDWELVPGFLAVDKKGAGVLERVDVVDWPFTDPFSGCVKKRRERKDSSGVAPDQVVE